MLSINKKNANTHERMNAHLAHKNRKKKTIVESMSIYSFWLDLLTTKFNFEKYKAINFCVHFFCPGRQYRTGTV